MSNLIENLYRPPMKREIKKSLRLPYFLLGAGAVLALATAYWSPSQPMSRLIASAGLYGMVLIGAVSDASAHGWKRYRLGGLLRDVAVAALWTCLLIIWIKDPTV